MAVRKKATRKKKRRVQAKKARKKVTTKKAAKARKVANATRQAAEQAQLAAERTSSIRHYAWRRDHYTNLQEFWPFYLHEHASGRNRLLHFIGSTLGLFIFAAALALGNYVLVIPALVSGYAFAWFGHYFIEKNRPATFKYPLKSFLSDWRMWWAILTGRISGEFKKYDIPVKK